jgi:hypothetical protein
MAVKVPLPLRLKVMAGGLRAVFSYPIYLVLAFASMLLALGIALWALNADLLRFVLFESGVSGYMKVEFFFGVYQSLFSEIDSLMSVVLVTFGVLFGINLSLLVFVLKRKFAQQKSLKGGGASLPGLILATIGGGCAACGTSILAPLFATFGITSVGLIRNIGLSAAFLGIALILYSAAKLSGQAASLKAY